MMAVKKVVEMVELMVWIKVGKRVY